MSSTRSSREGVDRVVVAGYSLGGNLALKLAGDYGDAAPPALKGVCAVSPVLELAECVRALERRQNVVYQWNFVRGLKARMRRKALTHPGRFPVERLADVRTVRQFDEYSPRRTSGSATRRITTIAPAPCESSIGSACPH